MSNPADQPLETTKSLVPPNNQGSLKNLQADLDLTQSLQVIDAYVTAVDPDYTDRYTIDIYEHGYNNPATLKGAVATAINHQSSFDKFWPCKAVALKGGDYALIRPSGFLQWFKLAEAYDPPEGIAAESYQPNRLKGWPAAQSGTTHSSIAIPERAIYINIKYPNSTNVPLPSTNLSSLGWYENSIVAYMQYDHPITMPEMEAYSGNPFTTPPTPARDAIPEFRVAGLVTLAPSLPGGGQVGQALMILDPERTLGWEYPFFV